MDATMIGIFIGLILTGMVAGIPIGQAFEHRRLLARRAHNSRHTDRLPSFVSFGEMKTPTVLTKEEIEDILNAQEIS